MRRGRVGQSLHLRLLIHWPAVAVAHYHGIGPDRNGHGAASEVLDAIAAIEPDWHADALCKESFPGATWFPQRGVDTREAVAICGRCLVRGRLPGRGHGRPGPGGHLGRHLQAGAGPAEARGGGVRTNGTYARLPVHLPASQADRIHPSRALRFTLRFDTNLYSALAAGMSQISGRPRPGSFGSPHSGTRWAAAKRHVP